MQSDEILAEAIAGYDCPFDAPCPWSRSNPITCEQCWLDWAHKKADESEHKPVTYINPEDA